MTSFLKTSKVTVEGENVEIVQLNALGHRQMMKAHANGDMFTAYAEVVKYGTKRWREKSPDEILDELPTTVLQSLAEQVLDISGLAEDEIKAAEKN